MSTDPEKRVSKQARVRARRTAVQAFYQWLINDQSMTSIIKEFEDDREGLQKADKGYFTELLQGMSTHSEQIDAMILPYLDRPLNEVNPVEHAILCLGMYELNYRPEIPWRVVMNESIELAKMFGAEQSHTYINGVLDKAARDIRAAEVTGSD